MKETFGKYIRALRNENGYTLTQLAARLDMDSANLSKVENGKREFDKNRLHMLANVFNLNLNELKDEYYSDVVAKQIYESNCSDNVLILAERKVRYLKEKNSKQSELNL